MKIESVLVATEPDQDLSYLKMADRVVRIGGARNYLSADAIIQAALDEHCSALHPGWGFLSENPTFARRCESARITFIGPSAACMRSMADKAVARETMTRLGLPPIPGSNGVLRDLDAARSEAERIGYPVLLKAVAGVVVVACAGFISRANWRRLLGRRRARRPRHLVARICIWSG